MLSPDFKRAVFALALLFSAPVALEAQPADPSLIFAHNDYEQPVPFHNAHSLNVGYIEADVFLVGEELLVAHHSHEIKQERTLKGLYLNPLSEAVSRNSGYAYSDSRRKLTLMIDIKSEAAPTLSAIVALLRHYPQLVTCATLQFMISGNVPPPSSWDDYPEFIHFDGRPGIAYTPQQLARIAMISTSFRDHVSWDGKGSIPAAGRERMKQLIGSAHKHGKKFRFWATPDTENAWKQFMAMNMDVIVTDNVSSMAAFLANRTR